MDGLTALLGLVAGTALGAWLARRLQRPSPAGPVVDTAKKSRSGKVATLKKDPRTGIYAPADETQAKTPPGS